ncbi:MAG: hypothetical protein QS721_05700 [Candidatus Endonucleobacter sp. (ex Gigantidas childressi)]|nr:hypothetical protein [Candidatus Endonucleobacter sp. (ex Gigantidas childressi)]
MNNYFCRTSNLILSSIKSLDFGLESIHMTNFETDRATEDCCCVCLLVGHWCLGMQINYR